MTGIPPDEMKPETEAYPMRLQKFLARAGVASRRGSEDLMTAGRVTVNGQVARELGTKVVPGDDIVAVEGAEVTLADGCIYLMLNKPAGYTSTMSDPHARHTVAQLVPTDEYPGLFPVGRLDSETTGLLLFTTDGEFSHRILHPKWKVHKRYVVEVQRALREGELQWLRDGVMLDDGLTAPALVERIGTRDLPDADYPTADVLSLTIHEGRNRQIRRMCETIGHPVITLRREAFGSLVLGDLEKGVWRLLTEDEVESLRSAVDLSAPEHPGA